MTRRRVGVTVLVTVLVWVVLTGALAAAGARPSVAVLAALVAACAVAVVLIVDLGQGVRHLGWTRPPSAGAGLVTDRRAMALRQQLARAEQYGATELQAGLVALVDDRLLAHHHIDRAADPEAAAAILPTVLRDLVDPNGAPVTSLRRLDVVVTAIEAL